jgi:hypothetical protein
VIDLATSTGAGNGRTDGRTSPLPLAPPDSPSRYDLTLLAISVAFLCALVLGSVLPVPSPVALVGAAIPGAVVVVDALFRNPPTG